MMSNSAALEREALEFLEPRLNKDGYSLVRNPSPADLPQFLRNFQPDAIAIGGPPNLLIEVLASSGAGKARIDALKVERLRALLAEHPDWRLEVVYARGSGSAPNIASLDQIQRRLDQVRQLAPHEPAGALLLAWALLEAAARLIAPERASAGLTPGSMIELLVGLGYVAQPASRLLRASGELRNAIAHGDLAVVPPAPDDIGALLDIVDGLVDVLKTRNSEAGQAASPV